MKNYFFIFLLLSNILFAQENKIIVNYKFEYLTDSIDVYSKRNDVMTLEILGNNSVFYSKLKKEGDSLLQDDINKGVPEMIIVGNRSKYHSNKLGYVIHKKKEINQIVFLDKILENVYIYEEGIPNIQWEISNEIQEFMGYNVRKATGKFSGRDYVAWYAEEIPISDGPYKFSGLPGLILKIMDTKNNFNFEAQEILKSKQKVFSHKTHTKVIPVAKSKYNELKERSIKDFLSFVQSASEVKIKAVNPVKRKEKPYNPIELEP